MKNITGSADKMNGTDKPIVKVKAVPKVKPSQTKKATASDIAKVIKEAEKLRDKIEAIYGKDKDKKFGDAISAIEVMMKGLTK